MRQRGPNVGNKLLDKDVGLISCDEVHGITHTPLSVNSYQY